MYTSIVTNQNFLLQHLHCLTTACISPGDLHIMLLQLTQQVLLSAQHKQVRPGFDVCPDLTKAGHVQSTLCRVCAQVFCIPRAYLSGLPTSMCFAALGHT